MNVNPALELRDFQKFPALPAEGQLPGSFEAVTGRCGSCPNCILVKSVQEESIGPLGLWHNVRRLYPCRGISSQGNEKLGKWRI